MQERAISRFEDIRTRLLGTELDDNFPVVFPLIGSLAPGRSRSYTPATSVGRSGSRLGRAPRRCAGSSAASKLGRPWSPALVGTRYGRGHQPPRTRRRGLLRRREHRFGDAEAEHHRPDHRSSAYGHDVGPLLDHVQRGDLHFRELRSKLEKLGHRFATESDTEVVVQGFEAWGPKVTDHLNGMFAFAIWDTLTRDLFLARDRMGIKPLYYTQAQGLFGFASEVKALLRVPILQREIDDQALWDYLSYRYVPGPDTLFRGIRKLPPDAT